MGAAQRQPRVFQCEQLLVGHVHGDLRRVLLPGCAAAGRRGGSLQPTWGHAIGGTRWSEQLIRARQRRPARHLAVTTSRAITSRASRRYALAPADLGAHTVIGAPATVVSG